MKHEFFTTWKYFVGHLISIIYSENIILSKYPSIDGYNLVKPIRLQGGENFNSVALYQNKKDNLVIIKHLKYEKNLLAAYQIKNEASMLSLLSDFQYKGKTYFVTVPKLIKYEEKSREIFFIMEFAKGELLENIDLESQSQILKECIDGLKKFSRSIPDETKALLPSRSEFFMFCVCFAYFIISCVKEPQFIFRYVKILITFYFNSICMLGKEKEYVLSHKSLHLENVIVDNKNVSIIDPQVSVYAEENTDLAFTAIMYLPLWKQERLIEFIRFFVKSKDQYASFERLAVYYCLQTLALTKKGSGFYSEALEFSRFYTENDLKSKIISYE